MSNQIELIQKTEKDAANIINAAHTEVKKMTASIKSAGEQQVADTVHRLKKEMADIDKKAATHIKSEQTKIAAEEEKELGALEKVKKADPAKAVDLIIKKVLNF